MSEQSVLSVVLPLLVSLAKSRENGLPVDPIAYAWRVLHGVELPAQLRPRSPE